MKHLLDNRVFRIQDGWRTPSYGIYGLDGQMRNTEAWEKGGVVFFAGARTTFVYFSISANCVFLFLPFRGGSDLDVC